MVICCCIDVRGPKSRRTSRKTFIPREGEREQPLDPLTSHFNEFPTCGAEENLKMEPDDAILLPHSRRKMFRDVVLEHVYLGFGWRSRNLAKDVELEVTMCPFSEGKLDEANMVSPQQPSGCRWGEEKICAVKSVSAPSKQTEGFDVFTDKQRIYLNLKQLEGHFTTLAFEASATSASLAGGANVGDLDNLYVRLVNAETEQEISAGIGRYGPYLKYDINFISIPADETVINIGLNHAVVMIGENSDKLGRVLGDHPDGNGKVLAKSGRFGPYVEYNKIRATLPKSFTLEEINLEQAIELIVAKAAKPPRFTKKPAKKTTKKTKKKK